METKGPWSQETRRTEKGMVRGGRGHGRKVVPLEGQPMNHQARPEQLSVQGRNATGLICIHRLIQSRRGVRLGHFSAITLATGGQIQEAT